MSQLPFDSQDNAWATLATLLRWSLGGIDLSERRMADQVGTRRRWSTGDQRIREGGARGLPNLLGLGPGSFRMQTSHHGQASRSSKFSPVVFVIEEIDPWLLDEENR